jgi:hypothetical protein
LAYPEQIACANVYVHVQIRENWLRAMILLGSLPACAATTVKYVGGQCVIDGVPAALAQVEDRQAEMTQHVLSRQPILTGIAVMAVALGIAGYLPRIFAILAARRAHAEKFGDRLRARIERYRAHPVRYFLLVAIVLGALVSAGVGYVVLDSDKRASERALASLQFCHLALRTANEQRVLAEQREHLASIQSTERDIQALVDKLPPAEQQKAREIVGQLSTTLGQQRVMVEQFAQHADTAAKEVAEQQVEVQRGLSKLDGEVVDLKSLPAAVTKLTADVHELGARGDTLGGEIEGGNARLDALAKSVDAVAKQVDGLVNRAPPSCPTCVCGPVAAASPAPQQGTGSGAGAHDAVHGNPAARLDKPPP